MGKPNKPLSLQVAQNNSSQQQKARKSYRPLQAGVCFILLFPVARGSARHMAQCCVLLLHHTAQLAASTRRKSRERKDEGDVVWKINHLNSQNL